VVQHAAREAGRVDVGGDGLRDERVEPTAALLAATAPNQGMFSEVVRAEALPPVVVVVVVVVIVVVVLLLALAAPESTKRIGKQEGKARRRSSRYEQRATPRQFHVRDY